MKKLPKINRNWPAQWEDGFIKTENQMGIMTVELSPAALSFTEFAKTVNKPVLDVGAAYGAATYQALENGAEVIALDIDQQHLEKLKENVPEVYNNSLHTICANFPLEVNFADNSLGAILIAQVLHFFNGEMVMESLKKCYQWLMPGGKIFIVVMTPHLSFYYALLPEFIKRMNTGEKWPGIFNPRLIADDEWKNNLPEFVHLFDKDIITRACVESGFVVESCDYFHYKKMPAKHLNDGKEWISLIARK